MAGGIYIWMKVQILPGIVQTLGKYLLLFTKYLVQIRLLLSRKKGTN